LEAGFFCEQKANENLIWSRFYNIKFVFVPFNLIVQLSHSLHQKKPGNCRVVFQSGGCSAFSSFGYIAYRSLVQNCNGTSFLFVYFFLIQNQSLTLFCTEEKRETESFPPFCANLFIVFFCF
jgi:hypothetical protein